MLFTLKWMIFSRFNAIKEFANSFSSLTLHLICCTFVALKENTLRRELGGLPQIQKFELSPSVWYDALIADHILGKKASPVAFRQILLKTLPAAYIFSYTVMTNLKNLNGTKSLNIKPTPAELSPRIIPHYPPKLLLEILGMGKNTSWHLKIYSFSPPEKSSLINLHLLLSKVSFLPPSNSNFYLITLYKLHL